jgi:hypothetical protein
MFNLFNFIILDSKMDQFTEKQIIIKIFCAKNLKKSYFKSIYVFKIEKRSCIFQKPFIYLNYFFGYFDLICMLSNSKKDSHLSQIQVKAFLVNLSNFNISELNSLLRCRLLKNS